MSTFCKCSYSKFYKISHILRHFICGFRSRKVDPADKIYGSHFGYSGLELFIYTATISPILFSNYIDRLLILLKKSEIGCHLNGTYCGALAYADDITISCPSRRGLNRLLYNAIPLLYLITLLIILRNQCVSNMVSP